MTEAAARAIAAVNRIKERPSHTTIELRPFPDGKGGTVFLSPLELQRPKDNWREVLEMIDKRVECTLLGVVRREMQP